MINILYFRCIRKEYIHENQDFEIERFAAISADKWIPARRNACVPYALSCYPAQIGRSQFEPSWGTDRNDCAKRQWVGNSVRIRRGQRAPHSSRTRSQADYGLLGQGCGTQSHRIGSAKCSCSQRSLAECIGELDRMFGLDMYDFLARGYYAALGSFTTMDPLAEKHPETSPYVYCGNNPINRVDPTGMDWYTDEDGNRMWRRSQDEEYTDDDGKVWKNIGEEYILFNGRQLTYFQQGKNKDGELTLKVHSYDAVSGKLSKDGTFSYSDENQATKGGPIPEGEYVIWSQDIQKYDDLSAWNKFKSIYGGSTFPGGTDSWGDERTWIYPKSVNVTDPVTGEVVERTNMSIHGGVIPGSRGCIDLHINAPRFFYHLRQSTSLRKAIYLDVRYLNMIKK